MKDLSRSSTKHDLEEEDAETTSSPAAPPNNTTSADGKHDLEEEDAETTSSPAAPLNNVTSADGDAGNKCDNQGAVAAEIVEHSPVSVTEGNKDKRMRHDSQSTQSPILPFGADKSQLKDV